MIGRRRLATVVAVAAVALFAVVAPAAAQEVPPIGTVASGDPPPPPGANDWDCEPDDGHSEPVVLVHGLSANQSNNWQFMSPLLAEAGYCVFSLTYGTNPNAPPPFDEQVGGLQRMEDSAEELGAFIERVLDATGADEVDILGHSEGSLMPNYYVKFLDGADEVDDYIGLAALWDGTKLGGAFILQRASREFGFTPVEEALFAPFCESCRQFPSGSEFLEKMNSGGGPAVDGVTYTMILTRYDELVIPYTSGKLEADNATNFVVQQECPTDLAEHGAIAYDPVAGQLVLNALDPDDAEPVPCTFPGQ